MPPPHDNKPRLSSYGPHANKMAAQLKDAESYEHPDTQSVKSNGTIDNSKPSKSIRPKDEIYRDNLSSSALGGRTSLREFMLLNTGLSSKVHSHIGLLSDTEIPQGIMQSDLLVNMLGYVIRFATEELKLIGTKYAREKTDSKCILPDFTLEEKCTKPLFELHDYPTYLLGKDEIAYSLYKFHMDRCLIEKMLTNMAKEIIRKKSFEGFLHVLKKLLTSTDEENDYLHEAQNRHTEIVNIRQTRHQEIHINKKQMIGLNTELTFYKNELEDLKRENFVKEQYIDKWEKSRNRQNHVMYKQKIEKLEREIKEYHSEIAREKRVNIEVEKYTNMVHVDIQEELVTWSERYETELEEKELKIQTLKELTEEMTEKLTAFKIQYENQVQFIEEGRQLRAERIQQQKILAIREVAAVKIQAWWRGVRVRKGIGKMKKKKNKRGGKKIEAKKGPVGKKGPVKGKK